MEYSSLTYTKSDYARTLAATLAWFLNGQGDAVGLFTFDESMRTYLPARHRHGHLRQLMLALEQDAKGGSTDLNQPLQRVAELVRKRSLIVLISDLFAPVDELERHLGRLTAAGHELVLFHVLDPNELTFAFDRAMLFHDLESRRDVYLDPAAARDEYQRALERHRESVTMICRRLGIAFHPVVTDRPLELALRDFLRSRAERGKRIRRRTHATSGA
jgi:uncharacterized protein (DUF58 family)